MRKTKRKQLKGIAADKHESTIALVSSPIPRAAIRTDDDEDSWVIVKKQRIRIFIPSLPVTVPIHCRQQKNKQVHPGIKKQGRHRNKRNVTNCSLEDASVKQAQTILSFEEEIRDEGSKKESAPMATDAPNRDDTAVTTSMGGMEAPELGSGSSHDRGLLRASNPLVNEAVELTSNPSGQLDAILLDVGGEPENPVRSQVDAESKPKEKETIMSEASPQKQRDEGYYLQPVQWLGESIVQVPNIRDLVLQSKLESAGGISEWLISKGLERFVDMFQQEKMGNLEFLNLTMGKLKDMGLDAVGPRRKLIHAINCLTGL